MKIAIDARGNRLEALRFFDRGARAGDRQSLLRAAGVLAPVTAQAALRRGLLSAGAWMARGRAWLGAPSPAIPPHAEVTIVQNTVRQYRTRFYACLREELDQRAIHLRVLSGNSAYDDDARKDLSLVPWIQDVRSNTLRFAGKRLVWQPILRHVRSSDLVIVEQASQMLVNYPLFAWHQLGGPAMAFWGHGVNYGDRKVGPAESLKHWMSQHVAWWFAYTNVSAVAVAELGFPAERVTVVQNASDAISLANRVANLSTGDIDAFKSENDLGPGPVLTFVGSLTAKKDLQFLLAAIDALAAQMPDLRFVVAGAGLLADEAVAARQTRPWMRVLGTVFDQELAVLLAASDLLLVPGWLGLAVVDAFAAGVPVIASASHSHPPEIDYLEDGVNGLLVDDSGDPQVYARSVAALLTDEQQRDRLAEGARASGQKYTVEAMAQRFAVGIEQALLYLRTPT